MCDHEDMSQEERPFRGVELGILRPNLAFDVGVGGGGGAGVVGSLLKARLQHTADDVRVGGMQLTTEREMSAQDGGGF